MSAAAGESVLEVEGLVTTFPRFGRGEPRGARIAVVEDVSLAVSRGEVLALVGESGCGKTMTALSLLRLVPKPGRVEGGSIRIAGQEITTLPVPRLRSVRGRDAAMIFQEPMTSLSPVATVGDQVIEAIRLHEPVSRAEARARTAALFDEVGIPDAAARIDAYPHQLSGGMKQRVMIAMALSTRPKLLIADEPTTALDVTIQAQILALLASLRSQRGMAMLLITHDLGVVNEVADRVAVMYAGRVVETGTRMEVLGAPRHPYTQGLLASMPGRAVRGRRLAEIPGNVPAVGVWPPGCRFAPRCARAFEACAAREPGPTRIGPSHTTWCHDAARAEGSA